MAAAGGQDTSAERILHQLRDELATLLRRGATWQQQAGSLEALGLFYGALPTVKLGSVALDTGDEEQVESQLAALVPAGTTFGLDHSAEEGRPEVLVELPGAAHRGALALPPAGCWVRAWACLVTHGSDPAVYGFAMHFDPDEAVQAAGYYAMAAVQPDSRGAARFWDRAPAAADAEFLGGGGACVAAPLPGTPGWQDWAAAEAAEGEEEEEEEGQNAAVGLLERDAAAQELWEADAEDAGEVLGSGEQLEDGGNGAEHGAGPASPPSPTGPAGQAAAPAAAATLAAPQDAGLVLPAAARKLRVQLRSLLVLNARHGGGWREARNVLLALHLRVKELGLLVRATTKTIRIFLKSKEVAEAQLRPYKPAGAEFGVLHGRQGAAIQLREAKNGQCVKLLYRIGRHATLIMVTMAAAATMPANEQQQQQQPQQQQQGQSSSDEDEEAQSPAVSSWAVAATVDDATLRAAFYMLSGLPEGSQNHPEPPEYRRWWAEKNGGAAHYAGQATVVAEALGGIAGAHV